ncbi:MAG TPA: hypothetical protein VE010_18470 [Thermoanaerobaculia bacterium]|nr:hypothetical protein [Thermoanaerobaculia bacterium]
MLKRYRRALVLSTAAVTVLAILGAVLLYLYSGAQRTTTLPFRLDFEGADRREYANGRPFSAAEIVSTPILSEVYARNELARYVTFEQFKAALFVSESNLQLDALARDYGSRIADPRLSAADRDRLNEEYELKKSSLRRSDFELHFLRRERLQTIPLILQKKLLTDVLAVWAASAVREYGVLRSDMEILSPSAFRDDLAAGEGHLVAADMLRSRVLRLIAALEELRRVPGAGALRGRAPQTSLAELRLHLDELVRFRLEPLIERAAGTADAEGLRYIAGQMEAGKRERDRVAARVEVIRDSLALYVDKRSANPAERIGASAAARAGSGEEPREVVPQIDQSFLNSIVELAVDSRDVAFRQSLITAASTEALTIIPLDQQLAYYGGLASRQASAAPLPAGEATRRYRAALEEVRSSAKQATVLYTMLLEGRSAGKGIYSLTAPVREDVAPGVLPSRLALLVTVLVLLWLVAAVTAVFVYVRIAAEKAAKAA